MVRVKVRLMKQKRMIKLKTLLLALLVAFSAGYIPQSSANIRSEIVVTAEAKDKFSLSDVPKYKDAASVEVQSIIGVRALDIFL